MLAFTGTRLDARVPSGCYGLASATRYAARLLEAATQLWQGRGHARTQVAAEVQRRGPCDLVWQALQQRLFLLVEFEPAPNLSRHLGQRALSIHLQSGPENTPGD